MTTPQDEAILQAAREVAKVARTCPPGFTDDIDNPDSLWTGHLLDQAVEKLVLAVEAKHGRAS